MESWSFPPEYDPDYLPDPATPYWFPRRETMDPGERERAIVVRLGEVMRHAWDNAPFYRRTWEQAGIHPDQIRSLEDFERVPVVTKQELREAQARVPPFGDYLAVPDAEIHRIHGTSGTTGRPTAFAIGRADWRTIADNHARIMWGMGIRPGDTVFVAAIFSLYMGSWGTLLGAERLRCKAFPFGAGAPGMTARAVEWLKTMKPRGFYSTPSYALHLADVARDAGVDPREFGLRVMFFSGEPGASIPAIRDRIADAFGAGVRDCGTMAEMTPFMSAAATEDTPEGMLLWQDIVYHEVCDPGSWGRVPYGQRGTPVYTHLERTSQPMIRLASGDLTHWVDGPNPCGRTYPRLPDGVYGRIDDMITVRGENVYPSEIDAVLGRLEGYREHRVVITRERAMDALLIRLEVGPELYGRGEEAREALRLQASRELQKVLGLRAEVELVPPDTFPRTDFKARRVVDDRDLFRSLAEKLNV